MTNVSDSSSSGYVEILPATKEEMPIVANLFELYAHDFSEFHAIEPGPDGRFGYPDLPLYWSDPGRRPFLMKIGGMLAGFVLVQRISQTSESKAVWDMAEFFVLRGYRRRGVGREAAHSVWRRFPGPWQVRVMRANQAARSFWRRAIAEFAGEGMSSTQVERAGEMWDVFWFVSSA
jgi:predicted acetyltransferase